jgi:hypothetical protein
MTLLNIFDTGGLTLGLSIVAFGLIGWFGYQAYRAHNSGWVQQDLNKGTQSGKEKIPYWKIPQFWFAVAVLVLYIIAMFIVASDYRGA